MTSDTGDRILNSAEQLFAGRGLATVTLRDITAAADVNLAAGRPRPAAAQPNFGPEFLPPATGAGWQAEGVSRISCRNTHARAR